MPYGIGRAIDHFLRGRGHFAPDADATGRAPALMVMTLVFAAVYGAVMGSFGLITTGQTRLLGYTVVVAAKTPVLLLATYVICLPSFYVINSLFGLRQDFGQALSAVLGTLAALSIMLAALAPVTAFFYANVDYYDAAILFNGLLFAVAVLASVTVVRRYYAPLIARNRQHLGMMTLWFVMYVFVAIQMAWTLRPFVGDPNPDIPVVILRSQEIDNAYTELFRLMGQVVRNFRN